MERARSPLLILADAAWAPPPATATATAGTLLVLADAAEAEARFAASEAAARYAAARAAARGKDAAILVEARTESAAFERMRQLSKRRRLGLAAW